MIVETKIVGRRTPFEHRPVDLPGTAYTLGELLTHLVTLEVSAYTDRQQRVGLLRVMTEPELGSAAASGRVAVAPQAHSGPADLAEARRVALRAFGDGMYYVFVDDQQIETLDEPLTLRADSTVLLLRLTALAGG